MVPKNKQIGLWIAWLVIWPCSLWIIYNLWQPELQGYWIDVISFGALMCIVAFFPLIVNNTPIFFVNGISLAVFIYFGLFVKIILTQLTVLVLLAKLRVGMAELYRIPLNMVMFLLISVSAALVYELLGGEHGSVTFDSVSNFLAPLGYIVTVFFSNQLLLKFFQAFIKGVKSKAIDRSLLWEFITTLLVTPVGFILYMLYTDIEVQAIYYIGLPFIGISIILMLLYSSKKINHYLQKTSEIGHELTGKLKVNEVSDLFMKQITSLLPVDYAYIYDVIDDKNMSLFRFYDAEEVMEFPAVKLRKNEGISGQVWANKKGVHYTNKKRWTRKDREQLPDSGESVISLPVVRNKKVVGVLTLISNKKRAYEKSQYMIVDILTNYFAVALGNARNYEATRVKNERDTLTNLYNYSYFESYLQDYFNEMNQRNMKEYISLLLLDLDNFKQINDTYGHQGGNEILQELANRLKEAVGDKGIVARYGGEEFVIVLSQMTQTHCYYVAEATRKAISEKPFFISGHILDEGEPIEIDVTASIGISTYPENCEDPSELVRHADRAMYIGAKQNGRNKVAVYEKMSENA